MKKQKLDLDTLSIKSFVTNVNSEKVNILKGGSGWYCNTEERGCLPPDDKKLPDSGQITCELSTINCC